MRRRNIQNSSNARKYNRTGGLGAGVSQRSMYHFLSKSCAICFIMGTIFAIIHTAVGIFLGVYSRITLFSMIESGKESTSHINSMDGKKPYEKVSSKDIIYKLNLANLKNISRDIDVRLPKYAVEKAVSSGADDYDLIGNPRGIEGIILPDDDPRLGPFPSLLRGALLIDQRFNGSSEYNGAVTISNKKLNRKYLRFKFIDEVAKEDKKFGSGSENDDRPFFVFHIGPGKTGTTDLQVHLKRMEKTLQRDNYHYLGINPLPQDNVKGTIAVYNTSMSLALLYCNQVDSLYCGDTVAVQEFQNALTYHRERNHNLIYSFENWASMPIHDHDSETDHKWELWMSLLQDWRVKIVISYRRYHEWLGSLINQHFKSTYLDADKKPINWPDAGGWTIPEIPEMWSDNFTPKYYHFESFFNENVSPLNAYEKWSKYFDVSIYDMYEEGDSTRNFVCNHLPGAKNTCSAKDFSLENMTDPEELLLVKNPSVGLHYDMLAVGAYKRGWIKLSMKREEARDAVECKLRKLNQTSIHNFPLNCLTEEQTKHLRAISLKYEKLMIPNKRVANSDELFQKSFHENVNKKKKFCSIDVEKSLNDEVVVNWKKFFFDLKLGSDGNLPISETHCGKPATNSQIRYNRELQKTIADYQNRI